MGFCLFLPLFFFSKVSPPQIFQKRCFDWFFFFFTSLILRLQSFFFYPASLSCTVGPPSKSGAALFFFFMPSSFNPEPLSSLLHLFLGLGRFAPTSLIRHWSTFHFLLLIPFFFPPLLLFRILVSGVFLQVSFFSEPVFRPVVFFLSPLHFLFALSSIHGFVVIRMISISFLPGSPPFRVVLGFSFHFSPPFP